MNTKATLLLLVQEARCGDYDADRFLGLILAAVSRQSIEDIQWYMANCASELDILLIIVLTDLDLNAHYSHRFLTEAVRNIAGRCRTSVH